MFVVDTIKPKSIKNGLYYDSNSSLRVMGFVSALVCYFLLMLNLNRPSQSQDLVSLSIIAMMLVGVYLFIKDKQTWFQADTRVMMLRTRLMGITVMAVHVPFESITNITFEERSHGQTVQKKYRIFVHTAETVYDIGIVNTSRKAYSINKDIRALIGIAPTGTNPSASASSPSEE